MQWRCDLWGLRCGGWPTPVSSALCGGSWNDHHCRCEHFCFQLQTSLICAASQAVKEPLHLPFQCPCLPASSRLAQFRSWHTPPSHLCVAAPFQLSDTQLMGQFCKAPPLASSPGLLHCCKYMPAFLNLTEEGKTQEPGWVLSLEAEVSLSSENLYMSLPQKESCRLRDYECWGLQRSSSQSHCVTDKTNEVWGIQLVNELGPWPRPSDSPCSEPAVSHHIHPSLVGG